MENKRRNKDRSLQHGNLDLLKMFTLDISPPTSWMKKL